MVSSYDSKQPNDIYSILSKDDYDRVAASPGDSGGPLLDKSCRIRGVASRVTESLEKKVSIHVTTASDEAQTFFKAVKTHFAAKFCEPGEGCERLPNYVGPVAVDDPMKFPCKANAEDGDPVLIAAIERLKKTRDVEAAKPTELFSCFDRDKLNSRSAGRGLCVDLSFVKADETSKVCDASMISPVGERLIVSAEFKELNELENKAYRSGPIGEDYAFIELRRRVYLSFF